MKLVFLGTRGGIQARSRRHRRHTSTLVSYRGGRVLIDCGEDWRGKAGSENPAAIVITHAHPDHALGLADGAPCPVFATAAAWKRMDAFAIRAELRRVLSPREPVDVEGIRFETFPVVHSVREPAAGFRITAGTVTIFYVPDVARIPDRSGALRGARVYVGDGATLTRSMVRRDREGNVIGHASVATQLDWCARSGVPEMIVTHCGSAIVGGDERRVRAKLGELAETSGVSAEIAHDGMERVLRGTSR
jgi:phosphoribosyl 1,2-cyclic phosphodiesterase